MRSRIAAATADTFEALSHQRGWLASIDEDILRTQIAIAQIPAPTGAEGARGEWMAAQLRAAGLLTRIDDERNVVARSADADGDAPVVVCAHLDTVFPAETSLDVQRHGTHVTGPGICDNSRGLAVMLALAHAAQRCRGTFARDVEFVATTGEEGAGDLRGARHFFATTRRPFAVIALDGAGDERIVNTALGSRRFRIEYRGPGGHSWASFGIANPVHAAARAANALANIRLERASRSALSVSRIGGGVAINAIPEDGWLEVDARSTRAATLDRLEAEVRVIAAAAAAEENHRRRPETPAMTCVVHTIGARPCGQTDADAPLVVAALEATRLSGRSPELATASTDASVPIGDGVAAIAIGAGGQGGDAHSRREWFDNSASTAGVERAFTIIATMARLAG